MTPRKNMHKALEGTAGFQFAETQPGEKSPQLIHNQDVQIDVVGCLLQTEYAAYRFMATRTMDLVSRKEGARLACMLFLRLL